MDKITFDRAVTTCGNSLVMKLTKEIKMLDVKEGEIIRVTLEKVK